VTKTFAFLAAVAAATVAVIAVAGASASAPKPTSWLPAIKGPALTDATSDGCLFTPLYGFACYGPYELGKAYNFPNQKKLDGSGQTIVIVDAYGSKTIQSDLDAFDAHFNVPNTTVQIINGPSTGATDGSGDVEDWGVETSLDVEYAHAMAPGAHIVLAVAYSDDDDDINAAEATVLPRFPGAIVSQSFGGDETDPTATAPDARAHLIYLGATILHDTILASAGDYGATDCFPGNSNCDPNTPVASFPASDPLVTAVGGTQGNPYDSGLYQNGGYGGEAVWNEPDYDAATGGAPSVLFPSPSFQQSVTHSKQRIVPDVSYNAAIQGGVEVVFTSTEDNVRHVYLVGGTSCGSPQWASIFALANQARAQKHEGPLGYANDNLYNIAKNKKQYQRDFHDITVGDNKLDETQAGFSASTGYDDATGLGTPNVSNLVDDLASAKQGGNPGFPGPGPLPKGFGKGSHGKPHTMQPGR
jgi:subtilase family serine protease